MHETETRGWIGFVEEIDHEAGRFWFRYYDLEGEPWECEARIDDLVPESDRDVFFVGALFRWPDEKEPRQFEFCREVWTQEEIDAAYAKAEKLSKKLKWT